MGELLNIFKYKIWPVILWFSNVVLRKLGFDTVGEFARDDDGTPDVVRQMRAVDQECSNLKERIVALENENNVKRLQIDDMKNRLGRFEESLALNTAEVADVEQRSPYAHQQIHSYNGTLLWKIESYQRGRQDAISGMKTALYSPQFYSARYEYKLCAKIFLNGDGFGKGTHLSLFLFVMKGDYDSLLTWPSEEKMITMMLLDQGNGDHMVDAFYSDQQSSSFQRPKSDINVVCGFPRFIPIDSLSNRQYIKDDVMYIKIIVK